MSRIHEALKKLESDGVTAALHGELPAFDDLRGSHASTEISGNGYTGKPRTRGGGPRVRSVNLARICPLLSQSTVQSYAAEQYRMIRTKMCHSLKAPFLAVVTSPDVGDGKTLTAINIAAAMALKNESPTLLVDADLRRAAVHQVLDLPAEKGLADVIEARCSLDDAIFGAEEIERLHILPAGNAGDHASELLGSSGWKSLTEELRRRFAHVILDSPPVDIVADYALIAQHCDGVILVVRPEHSHRSATLAAIQEVKPKLTGVVINAAPDWLLWKKSSRRYRYCYGNSEARVPRNSRL